jgi:hypothetical protein
MILGDAPCDPCLDIPGLDCDFLMLMLATDARLLVNDMYSLDI